MFLVWVRGSVDAVLLQKAVERLVVCVLGGSLGHRHLSPVVSQSSQRRLACSWECWSRNAGRGRYDTAPLVNYRRIQCSLLSRRFSSIRSVGLRPLSARSFRTDWRFQYQLQLDRTQPALRLLILLDLTLRYRHGTRQPPAQHTGTGCPRRRSYRRQHVSVRQRPTCLDTLIVAGLAQLERATGTAAHRVHVALVALGALGRVHLDRLEGVRRC